MKKSFLALGALTLLLFASCKEDFNVAAPYKNITVVYGMLNVADTAHYIRIQKAFLDESKSAIEMAQNPDSLYFPEGVLSVRFKEINASGSVVFEEEMSRVDLSAEGYPKAGGTFAHTPNIGYKSKKTLNPNNKYRVVIHNTQTGDVDSAETYVITNSTNSSNGFYISQVFIPTYRLNFSRPQPKSTLGLTVHVPQNPPGYSGRAVASYFEGGILFKYTTKQGSDSTEESVLLSFGGQRPGTEANGTFNLSILHDDILNFLANAIPAAAPGQERYLDSADLFVWAAGPDYANYQQFAATQGGLTADQIRPVYTNIRGTDAFGLLSTRALFYRQNVAIDDVTLDTIKNTPSLQHLHFVGRKQH